VVFSHTFLLSAIVPTPLLAFSLQHYESRLGYYEGLEAEYLKGWLTLRMDRDGMNSFLSGLEIKVPPNNNDTPLDVDEAVQIALASTEKILAQSHFRLSLSRPEDVDSIERLVRGLAEHEKEPESVHINKEHFAVDLFRPSSDFSWCKCLLLEDDLRTTNRFCGIALFYFGYDLENGPFLYLEDLYIDEDCRGRSGGRKIMMTLATTAKVLQCHAFTWQALDWNKSALDFYAKLGAKVQDGLLTSRFAGPALTAFAENRPSNR